MFFICSNYGYALQIELIWPEINKINLLNILIFYKTTLTKPNSFEYKIW